jgi:CBS domain-containing protein
MLFFCFRLCITNTMKIRDTTVAKIMTKGPMCVTSDTSATDALNLMVSRGFRHLVIIDKIVHRSRNFKLIR